MKKKRKKIILFLKNDLNLKMKLKKNEKKKFLSDSKLQKCHFKTIVIWKFVKKWQFSGNFLTFTWQFSGGTAIEALQQYKI